MSLYSMYTRMSLLAILFMTFHMTDDVIRNQDGVGEGGFLGLVAVLTLVVWLYGILRLGERKSGYIISLLGSLGVSFAAFGHLTGMSGEAVVGEILTSSGPFFVWAVIALGVTGISSLIFSALLLFSPTTEKPAGRK